jgi:hypothetical protein
MLAFRTQTLKPRPLKFVYTALKNLLKAVIGIVVNEQSFRSMIMKKVSDLPGSIILLIAKVIM